jgi:hypothetical protein
MTDQPTQSVYVQAPPTNALAIASLVLGIVSLFLFWIPFLGWVPVIAGLAMGLIALQRPYGRGMAIAGVICSGVTLAIKVWFWMAIIGILGMAVHHHAY